ncbi:hypothetical protein CUMW_054130 [Citrus unshiu]|nr:hypothetical protein CUMW_054130 [Citrus unshiu]
MKKALTVVGALAFGWLAIELAFKPFPSDKGFEPPMDKSDPARDPDDAVEGSNEASSESDDAADEQNKDKSRNEPSEALKGQVVKSVSG